jgi:predicted nucleotidyltransferase component of viral defense system
MIPQSFIIEWSNRVPWQTNEQVEQDLIISRVLVEIFSDSYLSKCLAFRGGTALHKLYLHPQPRYSEDIDLVQITAEPIGLMVDRLKQRLLFLGTPIRKQKESNFTLQYRFESEFLPVQIMKLKIETNTREHFTVLGYQQFSFEVKSSWFTGGCNIITYKLEELLGTKLRALYQRRKGRDLYDLYKAMRIFPALNKEETIKCYQLYMSFSVGQSPSKKLYLQNLDSKMKDNEFSGDIAGLIRPIEQYDQTLAFELLKKEIIDQFV